MEVLTRTELKQRYQEIVRKIREGDVFIHPTDTIYGIGCNALNREAVDRIRKLKERPDSPLSIWVPTLEWVKKYCHLTKNGKTWIHKLPGPYTLIIPLKPNHILPNNVAPGKEAIGIRFPDHWFQSVIKETNVPIITTSANRSGQPFMTSLENLDPAIEAGVSFMIYEGQKQARPSKLVKVEEEQVKER
jgi:L-threonylcarbamoyladenylate synthase